MDYNILDIPISQPKTKMEQYSYTLYGRPKFGKSSFASMFPNALFFGFEQGQNALPVRLLPVTDWKHFKSLVEKLVQSKAEGKHIPYINYVVDTADIAYKYCQTYVCKKNGWSHPSEGEWGAGWSAVSEEFFYEMDRLSKLGTADNPSTIIYIAHHAEKEFKPKTKPKYNKIVPDVPSGAREIIVDKVDFVVFCEIDSVDDGKGNMKDVRRLFIRDNGEFEAGSRLMYMPEFIEFGDSPKTAYDNFRQAFDEAVIKEFGGQNKTDLKKSVKKEKADKPVETDTKVDLKKILDDVEREFNRVYKNGKSAEELFALLKDFTGKDKIGEITDFDKAVALLDKLRGFN